MALLSSQSFNPDAPRQRSSDDTIDRTVRLRHPELPAAAEEALEPT
jgi:hypothetical protein